MIKSKQIPTHPKPSNAPTKNKPWGGHKYLITCPKCYKSFCSNKKVSKCEGCDNKDLKIYNQQGQEEAVPKSEGIPWYAIPGGILIWGIIIGLIIWVVRKRKRKKLAKLSKPKV